MGSSTSRSQEARVVHMNKQKPRILFFHNALVGYTRPFFLRLSEVYDVRFVFTDVGLSQGNYGVEEKKQFEGFSKVDYRVLKRYCGIGPGVISEMLKGDYDVVVDSLGAKEFVLTFFIAKIRRKPIVLWSEEWGWKDKSTEHKWFSTLIRFMVSHADAVFGPGSRHREYLISLGASPEKVFIVPNAVNSIINEDDYREKEKIKNNLNTGKKRVILFVGRLVKRKGVAYLIEAFSRLRKERDDILLVIVGRGESKPDLEALAAGLNIRDDICFVGYIEDKYLTPYYLLGDICVMPSITYEMGDPWVFVLNEAMAAGKPVIASDAVGAAYDMIKDGVNGFMVPERNSDALYKALKTILSDPALAKKMGEASKRIIEQGYTIEHMVASFNKAIESVRRGLK